MGMSKMKEFGIEFEALCRQHGFPYTIEYSSDGIVVTVTLTASGGIYRDIGLVDEVKFSNLAPEFKIEQAGEPAKKTVKKSKKKGK